MNNVTIKGNLQDKPIYVNNASGTVSGNVAWQRRRSGLRLKSQDVSGSLVRLCVMCLWDFRTVAGGEMSCRLAILELLDPLWLKSHSPFGSPLRLTRQCSGRCHPADRPDRRKGSKRDPSCKDRDHRCARHLLARAKSWG